MKNLKIKGVKSGVFGFAVILIILIVLSGCTRNNGDIGNWFGTWQMVEITADGEIEPEYARNIFWKFQNDVITLVKVEIGDGEHSREQRWGTWTEKDGYLYLDFTHADDKQIAGTGMYAPFPETHLPAKTVSALKIITYKGGELKLKYHDTKGVEYIYTLKKQ